MVRDRLAAPNRAADPLDHPPRRRLARSNGPIVQPLGHRLDDGRLEILITMAKANNASNAKSDTPTRAESEKHIASLDRVKDKAALEAYLKNPSKRLQEHAAFKLAEPEERARLIAEKNAKRSPG
jgi:hypothetical protein